MMSKKIKAEIISARAKFTATSHGTSDRAMLGGYVSGLEWALANLTDGNSDVPSSRGSMARKDEERWEALRQAAFDYVKMFNYWSSDDPEVEDPDAQLAHAEAVLRAEAERYRRRSEMRKAGA